MQLNLKRAQIDGEKAKRNIEAGRTFHNQPSTVNWPTFWSMAWQTCIISCTILHKCLHCFAGFWFKMFWSNGADRFPVHVNLH